MTNRRGVVVTKLTSGKYVWHRGRPDSGIGQVQSVIGSPATVNFEHSGKLLTTSARVSLETVANDEL